MRFLLACALLLVSVNALAEVYKWKDENGVIHYGDKPLSPDAKPVTLPQLQILNSSTKKSAPSSFKGGPAPYGGAGPHVEITQPAPDATLRAEGKFSVQVDIKPALSASQKLNYYLDGEIQNANPTAAHSFQYLGADKGDHMVSVAVINDEGREISRSEPVIVHLQPPPPKP